MTILTPTRQLLQIDEERGIFRVARRAFTDPDVLDRERRAIFDKCWLYIGHESEVDKPGKYQVRFVGGREMIFNCDRDGKVNAFLNACPHRGARLCTERSGSANMFYCYYHGWSFGTDGMLRVLPSKETFPADFNDDGSANMVRAPRLEQYRGLYFICFDPDAMSLSDYLGNTKPYIDLCLDQGDAGMEVVPGAHDYAIHANWKGLAENSVDGNHAVALHSTYFDFAKNILPELSFNPANAEGKKSPLAGFMRDLENGHTVIEYAVPWGRVAGKWWPAWGEEIKPEIEAAYRRLEKRVGTEKADRITGYSRNVLIFPNLAIVDSTGLTLRVGHPDTPGHMNVSSYALAEKGESPSVRGVRLAGFVEFLGPGGYATPDDVEALEQCQRSYNANADLPLWNDLSKGSLTAKEWPQDGEGCVRSFWKEWGRRMGEIGGPGRGTA